MTSRILPKLLQQTRRFSTDTTQVKLSEKVLLSGLYQYYFCASLGGFTALTYRDCKRGTNNFTNNIIKSIFWPYTLIDGIIRQNVSE